MAVLAACAAVAGCGGGDDDKDAPPENPRTLKRPILAPCAAPDYARPRITRAQPSVWSLQYTRVKPPRRREAGASKTILLVEYPPAAPRSRKFAGKPVTLAGRRVTYNDPSSKSPFYTAQWRTKRALYTLLADGTHPAAVRRFIGCLP
ncbi:MAG: hypothetical protein M3141_02490 [Actinomycetota bacterium]|nr:hypothetical protein [Actinomycetota bacterium]